MIHIISVGPLRQQSKLSGESDHPLLHIMDISEWEQGKVASPRKPQIAQMKHITMGTENYVIMQKCSRLNIWSV